MSDADAVIAFLRALVVNKPHAIRKAKVYDCNGNLEYEIEEHYLTCVRCQIEKEITALVEAVKQSD